MTEPYEPNDQYEADQSEPYELYEPGVADYGHAVLELHAEIPANPSTCRCGIPVALCVYRSLARQLGIPIIRAES